MESRTHNGNARRAEGTRIRAEGTDSWRRYAAGPVCASWHLGVAIPGNLEEVPVGIGEVAGVDAKGSQVGRGGQCAARPPGLVEHRVDLFSGCSRDAETEFRRAGVTRWQAGVLGEVRAFVEAELLATLEGDEGDGPVRAGDLVVEVAAHHSLGRPAQPITVEAQGTVEVIDSQGDEEDLCSHAGAPVTAGRVPCDRPSMARKGEEQ